MTEQQKAMIEVGKSKGGLVPSTFEGLYRMANIMSASGLMPQGIQTPEAVFVAVQMGLEVGLSPMQAVQNIAVVNGRPAIWGDSVLGLVRASGELEAFEEGFTGTWPEDNFTAYAKAKRRHEKEVVREFSIGDAKMAGLWKYPQTGVTPWHKYPKRMLQMRARSWALRDGFGDVLKGLRTAEEVVDYDIDLTRSSGGGYEAAGPAPEAKSVDPADHFDSVFGSMVDKWPNPLMDEFLKITAEGNDVSVEQIKKEALGNVEGFWGAFLKWAGKQQPDPTPTTTPQTADPAPGPESSESDQAAKMYPCPQCDFVAKSERGLKKHITQQHGESSQNGNNDEQKETTEADKIIQEIKADYVDVVSEAKADLGYKGSAKDLNTFELRKLLEKCKDLQAFKEQEPDASSEYEPFG